MFKSHACRKNKRKENKHFYYDKEGVKIATVIFKMDNFGTRNFDGAKPDIINQNGTNLALLNIGVKFDR